jgi:hypothetical protein
LDLETELMNLGAIDETAREVENFYLTTWRATLANDNDNDSYTQHFKYSHFTTANSQFNGNIANST